MPPPTKWSWNIGNVNATAAQTQAAYQALTNNGRTRDFSVIVWNDIIDKIIEQRQSWGDVAWSQIGVPLMTAYMAPGEQMTAAIFYSAVQNMPPIHPWGWEATLERKEIRRGDTCYGAYFIYLTDGLNHWMDLAPMPFVVNIPLQSTFIPNVLVRRALHVINSQNLLWSCSATVDTKSPLYIIVPMDVVADIRLNLPLFGTPHVEPHLYVHLWMNNNTVVLDSTPIVIDYPILLDTNVHATTLSMLSITSAVDGQLLSNVTLNTPNPLGVLVDLPITLSSSAVLSEIVTSQIKALITGTFSGEVRVREYDSAHFNASLNPEFSISAIVSSPNLCEIQLPLNVLWSPITDVSLLALRETGANLDPVLDLDVTARENTASQIDGEITGSHNMAVMIYRKRFESGSATSEFELNTSVTIDFATDDRDIHGSLSEQTDISIDIDFARNVQNTGAFLSVRPSISIDADIANSIQPAIVNISEIFGMTARIEVVPRYTESGGTLTSALATEATVSDLADYRVELIYAQLSAAFDSQAEIEIYDNRLNMSGNINASYNGSAEFDMLHDANISGNIDSESTISINVDTWNTPHIATDMSFSSTASMTIETKRLVLASELDNTLASDLDNTLVENVEFR